MPLADSVGVHALGVIIPVTFNSVLEAANAAGPLQSRQSMARRREEVCFMGRFTGCLVLRFSAGHRQVS